VRVKYYKKEIALFLLIICLIIIFIVSKDSIEYIYSNRENIKETILSFGFFGPLIIIILIIVANVVMVIPNYPIEMAGGYLYGVAMGTFWVLIGKMIGASILFYFGRKFGHSFVGMHLSNKEITHLKIIFRKNLNLMLFVTRISFISPNDITNLFMGLTPISFKDYFWISLIGYIPTTIVSCMMGKGLLAGEFDPMMIVLIIISVVLFLFYVFRHKIRALIFKEIRLFEEEA